MSHSKSSDLILGLLALSTFGLSQVEGQLLNFDFLTFNEKPQDGDALTDKTECRFATFELLDIPELDDAKFLMEAEVYGYAQDNPDWCQQVDRSVYDFDVICTLDYTALSQNYKKVCEENGGIFLRNDHELKCDKNGEDELLKYEYINHPMCFSSECSEADMERWLNKEIEDQEARRERGNIWVCDTDLVSAPTRPSADAKGICPYRNEATLEVCGPLGSFINEQDCDCYSFCGTKLVGCDLFTSIEAFLGADGGGVYDVICEEEDENLVLGCTVAQFQEYQLAQDLKAINNSSTPRNYRSEISLLLTVLLASLMISQQMNR